MFYTLDGLYVFMIQLDEDKTELVSNQPPVCWKAITIKNKVYSRMGFVTRSCLKPLSNKQKSMFKSRDEHGL